jgi:hypothetical protein
LQRRHAHSHSGVSQVDVRQMQPWDALDEASATIVARRYWRSRAKNAPSDSMDHLDLFVERHRLHDLCGSRVWILRRIHPRLRRLHTVCLLLRR